jgi:F-type H+-transporting ATPase subunit epsilon
MTETLRLEIVTPDGRAYSEDVEMVTLPGGLGEMGILPQHVRLMTQMLPGEVLVRRNGREEFLAVGGGLVEVTGTRVEILTDMAVAAESIDEAKAEEARRRAEARLKEKLADEELATTNAALARALAQLRVRRRHRGGGAA